MSEPNYNEIVVIPLLQNKFRDLTNTNLILEANLLIERAKNADLTEKYNIALNKLDKKKKLARKIYPHDEQAKLANHLKSCSCHMCGNPRKIWNVNTIQEMRMDQADRYSPE